MAQTLPSDTRREATSWAYAPRKGDKFSFGLWTVGNRGRDAFGDVTRPLLEPGYIVEKLSGLGVWGVNFQDDSLVAFDATASKRSQAAQKFKQLLTDHEMVAPMATTNLFTKAAFKEGTFTAVEPGVRAFALQKTLRAVDFAAEVGATVFDLWGAREGVDTEASKDPIEALQRLREAINFLCEYVIDQGYDMRFALEPKPNEPRSDSYLPTIGHLLAFISTLDHPERVGLNPEVAHETIVGLNVNHAIAQVLEAGKLFHIDLNDQRSWRYDQNVRFASENLKRSFFLVKLLEEGGYIGPRHFDVHPYRTEDEGGVWDAAQGCMHSYNMLKERVRRFAQDARIQELLAQTQAHQEMTEDVSTYNPAAAQKLKNYHFDLEKLAQAHSYEKLDQLTTELIMGTD